ncbi:MAG: patatin-like phospholipase family protein [Piscirickettsiaceae bacterium]|nr:patatin-like phospholipase family protein [Piscirickettsiaceae bacterium]
MFRLSLSLFFLTLFNISTSFGLIAAETQKERPKIGLALSGGGARGAAHVGVIKVLEELRIPIDYIAGTSMGAVVGGLYASGMSSDEVAEQLATINWDDVFNDKPSRPERSQRRKKDDLLYLAKGKIGVTGAGIQLPTAVVQGQKFDLILKALTLPVSEIDNFDQLPIPYRAVAMDIATGKEVVLGTGDLSLAMHASMAIPAVFAPIELNGQLLVDGGSANNLPISVVRDMGADIVIAIDISTPLLTKDELDGALAVIEQLTGILTSRNVAAQVKTLSENDILIVPELGTISTMGFDRVLEAVNVGTETGREMESQLAKLSLDETDYREYLSNHRSFEWEEPLIDFVRFDNNSSLDEQVLREHFDLSIGEPLDLEAIESGIATLYGLEVFQTVRYDVVKEDGKTGIIINAKQKEWGTDSLQSGIELSSDFTGQSSFNIGFAYTKQPFNALNGEWRTAIQLGEDLGFFTEIYQPLDPADRYFASAGISWSNQDVRLFPDLSGGRADAEYEVGKWELRVAVGRNIGKWGEVRIGLSRTTGNADIAVGDPSFENFDFDDGYFFARATVDTLDSLYFPRSGYLGSLKWTSARETLGADDEYDQVLLSLGAAKSWGDGTLITGMKYGSTIDGDSAIHNRYRLGGYMNLSGLQKNQLSGQHFGLLSVAYQHRLYRSQLFPVYAGAALQFGNTWEDKSDISTDDLIASGTLFVGADTPIGPLYLGYGVAEGDNKAAYLFIGQPFF